MRIYPAIDIKDGKCVRLFKGDYDKVTVYNDNPIEVAYKFKECGAEFIHLVDLDGARDGGSINKNIIFDIAKKLDIPVQTGGGIRDIKTVEEYISNGINRVILGTAAINDPEFLIEAIEKFGEKIVVGIDAKDGYAAYSGWEKLSGKKAVEFAKEVEKIGGKTIIYTDIATDGTLKGPSLQSTKEMVEAVNIDIIASGGVSSFEDIKSLKEIGVEGAIVGKAIYENKVDLKTVLKEI